MLIPSVSATNYTVYSSGDTSIVSGSGAGDNYGSYNPLLINNHTDPTSQIMEGLIRFNTSGYATVTNASLFLYVSTVSNDGTIELYNITDRDWNEYIVTYTTKPTLETPDFANKSIAIGDNNIWIMFNITDYVNDNLGHEINFYIKGNKTDNVTVLIKSREQAGITYDPYVVIDDGTLLGTSIYGNVYELISGVSSPLDNAAVYIYNNTYSNYYVTSTDGNYIFTGLNNSSTYNIYATRTGYDTTSHLPVTTLNGTAYKYDILMVETEPTDFESSEQFVKFRLRWLWCFVDCDIPGTTVTIYKSGDNLSSFSGNTDNLGTISFKLYKSQLYRITFINSTDSINQEMNLYPKDTEYVILITNNKTTMQEYDIQQKDAIIIDVSKLVRNTTAANITINYTDSLAQTTALSYWVNQTNLSDPMNQTVISSWTWVAGSYNHTFNIFNQSGQSYLVHIVATHTTYGTIDRTYAVIFEKTAGVGISGISNTLWMWFAIGIMFFTGAMFTSSTAEKGLLIVCAEGWIFFFMGMFASLGSIEFGIGLTLASVIAVLAYFKKSQVSEGYA